MLRLMNLFIDLILNFNFIIHVGNFSGPKKLYHFTNYLVAFLFFSINLYVPNLKFVISITLSLPIDLKFI